MKFEAYLNEFMILNVLENTAPYFEQELANVSLEAQKILNLLLPDVIDD